MNETIMTIVGNVVDDPRKRETKNGFAVTNFRVASTSRRFDREQEKFVDNGTLYVTVTCWRATAEHVYKSLRNGQPVIVTGRYYMREYTVDEQVRTAYELEATAVGHDLSRGTSEFTRVYQSGPAVTVVKDEHGVPKDESDNWLDLHRDAGEESEDEVATEPAFAAAS
jgi:single-strand DNA-binding protein